jgi:hypothetical protein
MGLRAITGWSARPGRFAADRPSRRQNPFGFGYGLELAERGKSRQMIEAT